MLEYRGCGFQPHQDWAPSWQLPPVDRRGLETPAPPPVGSIPHPPSPRRRQQLSFSCPSSAPTKLTPLPRELVRSRGLAEWRRPPAPRGVGSVPLAWLPLPPRARRLRLPVPQASGRVLRAGPRPGTETLHTHLRGVRPAFTSGRHFAMTPRTPLPGPHFRPEPGAARGGRVRAGPRADYIPQQAPRHRQLEPGAARGAPREV